LGTTQPKPASDEETIILREVDRQRAQVPAYRWGNLTTTETKEQLAVAETLIRTDEEAKRKGKKGPFLTDDIHAARLARLSAASADGIERLKQRAAESEAHIEELKRGEAQ
jgi:hypothetical protein